MTDAGPSAPSPAPAPGQTPPSPPPPNASSVPVGRKVGISLPPPHDLFSSLAVKHFSELDTDGDGFVGKEDLNRAIQNRKFTGDDGAMVAALKATVGDIEVLSGDELGFENDGVTLADLTEYDRRRVADPKQKTVQAVQARFALAQQKIAKSKVLFDGDPDVLAVQQGLIGDCWLLAALVAAGFIDKTFVQKVVKPTKDPRNIEVKFPGDKKGPILVLAPTDGEIGYFAVANGFWLAAIEKAYGAATNRDAFFWTDSSEVDAADSGSFVTTGIALMTGHDTDLDILDLTFETTTLGKLTTAFAGKKVVTAGVRNNFFGEAVRSNGLAMGHAYSVLGFDPAKKTLKLRNPWGNKGLPFQEIFDMSLDDFDKNFNTIGYEQ